MMQNGAWWVWDGSGWPIAYAILIFLTLQRALELVYANRNTKALLARGAREHGRSHYPAMVAIHAAFLVSLFAFTRPYDSIIWPLAILFLLLQAARIWVLATLGPYWTTRIISAPDFPRVLAGPFQYVTHPNYLVVTLEILTIPLIFGHIWIAVIFTALNAAILYVRIAAEDRVLKERQN
ncbi:isoprenylcysteine carboxylmethyltransferase family protein [Sphingorhabdus sp. Alg239-R122]|uniref:isoprenylcysteine carboxyl methyltransferase family protein n=1 Tax=Sphingorhabdus sp. Alg239-R122 TaxID=2305989 RepID=UPI0013DD31C5|nr:isoprenylcysteine carboxylmethyltransferase family protein [Sphingorhabdus sp. Alg239-R122]